MQVNVFYYLSHKTMDFIFITLCSILTCLGRGWQQECFKQKATNSKTRVGCFDDLGKSAQSQICKGVEQISSD